MLQSFQPPGEHDGSDGLSRGWGGWRLYLSEVHPFPKRHSFEAPNVQEFPNKELVTLAKSQSGGAEREREKSGTGTFLSPTSASSLSQFESPLSTTTTPVEGKILAKSYYVLLVILHLSCGFCGFIVTKIYQYHGSETHQLKPLAANRGCDGCPTPTALS